MQLLLSDIPPLRESNKSFSNMFRKLMFEADHLLIASGYISTDSITEIKKIIESNNRPHLNLMIGMHYFDGITRTQYDAARYLDDFLTSTDMGSVSIATTFRFHGKMYSFQKDGNTFAGIVGSSNLTGVLDHHSNYETDLLIQEGSILNEISDFINKATIKIAKPISTWIPDKYAENNPLLEGHESVKKVAPANFVDIRAKLTGEVFKIPLKVTSKQQKSNLNAYFGKGRKNTSTGFVKPRPWYEVELIVPKTITRHEAYPKATYPANQSIITVYTDDYWKFDCKISGDYSKNFRSYNDLKILGKWIKGRLEINGALQIGQPVTETVLDNYGRSDFELKKTSLPNTWILDFGV